MLDAKYGGSSFNASAGPADGGFGGGGFGGRNEFGGRGGFGPGAGFAGGMLGGGTTLTSAEHRTYDYVSARRDGAGYLMAVDSWSEASPYILATGQEVLAMGGFSGSVPEPTLATVKRLVQSACAKVPAADYGATAPAASGSGAGGFGFGGFGGGTQILYECGRGRLTALVSCPAGQCP